MARCKCQCCKKQLDTKEAFKVEVNGKNKYWCNETEYKNELAQKKKIAEDKDKVYRLICDVFGEQDIISTALYKEWAVWNKVASNEKIAQYLEENYDYLNSVITRLHSSEYAKIRYLSTIIRDKIKGFVPKVKIEQHEREIEISGVGPSNYKPRETRRGLDFLEE